MGKIVSIKKYEKSKENPLFEYLVDDESIKNNKVDTITFEPLDENGNVIKDSIYEFDDDNEGGLSGIEYEKIPTEFINERKRKAKNDTVLENTLKGDFNNVKASIPTKVNGSISPGTRENTFEAKPYNLTEQEKKELIALVYSEAVEHTNYIEADSMGVASTVLNRLEDSNFPDNIHDIISEGFDNEDMAVQFNGYQSTKYKEAMEDLSSDQPSLVKPIMIDSINRVLSGNRNTDALFFRANDDHNYTRFRRNYKDKD